MVTPWGCGHDPREHGMKLEAPGIEARVSHLPPHPHHRHSYPGSPFIPKFVTLLSPIPGRGGRSGYGHPTSLCGRRGGGWGISSARVPPAQLRLVTICRSLFFFSINLVGSRVVALGTLPQKRDLLKPQGGDNSLAVADFSELHEPLLGRPELVQALLVAGIAAIGALIAGDLAGELAGTVPELLDGRVEVLLIFLLLQNKHVRPVEWEGHPKELVPLVPGFPSHLGHLPWH